MADAPPAEPRILRQLWSKMAGIYGTKWTSAYGDAPEHLDDGPHHRAGELTDAGTVWAQGLAGVTPKEVATGLRTALLSADPWPPTLPAFRAMCLRIPTLAQVQLVLARRQDLGEPVAAFCRLVWRFMDAYRFARSDTTTADRILRDAYQLAREYRMQLGDLPPAPAGTLAHTKPSPPTRASEEVAAEHLRRLGELLHVSPEDLAGPPAADGAA